MNKITKSLVLLACVAASSIANADLYTGHIVNNSKDYAITKTGKKIKGFNLPPSVSAVYQRQFTIDSKAKSGTYWVNYINSNKNGCKIEFTVPGKYADIDVSTFDIGNDGCYHTGEDIVITAN